MTSHAAPGVEGEGPGIFRTLDTPCPNCGAPGMGAFYEVRDVPVHSVLLFPTREAALSYPKRDIVLAFCTSCGFIGNAVFDAAVHEYSERYEETQGFSGTFVRFHRELAERLIRRHGLVDRDIIEIGCGKGEFLTMLCELGPNRGIGFDPAYVSERNTSPAKERVTFVRDFYSERYTHHRGDFVCCKMTLEHIPDTLRFVSMVRRAVGERPETTVFFMIPETGRILRERAFWDIYYEHCSYFTPGSLARVFRRAGFDVAALGTEYDGQYLTIEARPGIGAGVLPEEEPVERLRGEVEAFVRHVGAARASWQRRLAEAAASNSRAVLWGAGSKGVAFLTSLGVSRQVEYAVDINPYKHGTFMAGTGQQIVAPQFLQDYRPGLVIVMNPIYMDEIREEMGRLGVRAELVSITGAEN